MKLDEFWRCGRFLIHPDRIVLIEFDAPSRSDDSDKADEITLDFGESDGPLGLRFQVGSVESNALRADVGYPEKAE